MISFTKFRRPGFPGKSRNFNVMISAPSLLSPPQKDYFQFNIMSKYVYLQTHVLPGGCPSRQCRFFMFCPFASLKHTSNTEGPQGLSEAPGTAGSGPLMLRSPWCQVPRPRPRRHQVGGRVSALRCHHSPFHPPGDAAGSRPVVRSRSWGDLTYLTQSEASLVPPVVPKD